MNSQEKALLDDIEGSDSLSLAERLPESGDEDDYAVLPVNRRSWLRSRGLLWSIGIHVMLFICNIALVLVLRKTLLSPASGSAAEPYSPANEAVRYTHRPLYGGHGAANPFVGPPGRELDQARHNLTYGTLIHVSKEELEQADMQSIQYADGSYVAGLGVFHTLHCLKKFKHYMHKEHYYANASAAEMEHEFGHLNHCLEVLRQELMCHADYSLYTFAWDTPDQVKPRTVADGLQRCVDWDHLMAWVLSRASGPHFEWIGLDGRSKRAGERGNEATRQTVALSH